MLPSIISRIGKKSGQGCRAGFEDGILRDPDFVEGPNDQRKEFLAFWTTFLWDSEVMGAMKLLLPFSSGPTRRVEQTYH